MSLLLRSSGSFRSVFHTHRHLRGKTAQQCTRWFTKVAATPTNQPTSGPASKRMQDTADTVIIGGGAVGTSIAYHLAKAGHKDVVLLEKMELTAGSTWHAAGLTTLFHPGINVKKLHFYSINLYAALEAETGQDVGFHRPGSIRLATIPERVDEFKYQMSRQGWNEAPQWLLTPDEVYEMAPLLNMDGILSGLYSPGDGHIDPYSLTMALAVGARRNGAMIYQNCPVSKVEQRADGGWDIDTPEGSIKANRVINAAGFHGREVGNLSGLDLPLVPIDHQYIVTTTIPEVQALKKEIPVIRDLEGSYYCRMERQGLLFGPYESGEHMRVCSDWYDQVPKGFGKELFQPDLDRIQHNIEKAMERIPVIQKAEIAQVVSGPITYSPDVLPMIGPHIDANNYWCAVGFAYGIIHAGGVGKYLSDWITNGEPPYDLIECDANRYGKWTDREYVLAKCRESYGFNNLLGYPNEERPAGRPVKRRTNSCYQLQKERGCQHNIHAGWEQPEWVAQPGDDSSYKPSFRRTNWFTPVGREVEMVMNRAGILDVTPFGKIEVTGKDACKFIDHIFANNVPKVGQTCITHMITPKGRVYSEMTVTQLADNHFFCITGSAAELHDLRWMKEKARAWGHHVTFTNTTETWMGLSIAGPKSREVLSKLTKEDLSHEKYPFLNTRMITVADVPVRAIRISYTGELGWEMYMDDKHMLQVYNALLEAGEQYGVSDFGTLALNSMRLEKGFRMWGAEMTTDHNPFEAGLGFFVKTKKKADFIGKAALQQLKQQPLKRTLVFMNVNTTDTDPEGNHTIYHDGKVVGMTTSGAYSFNTKTAIAFGYVPPSLSSPGTTVDIDILGERCQATVQDGHPLMIEPMRVRMAKSKS